MTTFERTFRSPKPVIGTTRLEVLRARRVCCADTKLENATKQEPAVMRCWVRVITFNIAKFFNVSVECTVNLDWRGLTGHRVRSAAWLA